MQTLWQVNNEMPNQTVDRYILGKVKMFDGVCFHIKIVTNIQGSGGTLSPSFLQTR